MKNYSIHQTNLWNSLSCARKLAQKIGGIVGTLPNLISLRVNSSKNKLIWSRWFSPMSLVAFGKHKGKRLIVVGHHMGPLSTKARLNEWTESGTKDHAGGREKYGFDGLPKIYQREFNKLVDGEYGPVHIINFDEYSETFRGHICGDFILYEHAKKDPLITKLFGDDTEKFLDCLHNISITHSNERGKEVSASEKILQLEFKDRYGWNLFSKEKDEFPIQPVALFLNLGSLTRWGNSELSSSVSIDTVHDLSNSNFVVFNDTMGDTQELEFNPARDWKKTAIITGRPKYYDFFTLMRCGNQLFSEYPKNGNRMDTGEPMYVVTHFEKIGEPTSFATPLHGSPFLKYHINEVKRIAPKGANAFEICGEIKPGKNTVVPVQFFNVTVDYSKRIPRREEVKKDLSLLIKINGIKV